MSLSGICARSGSLETVRWYHVLSVGKSFRVVTLGLKNLNAAKSALLSSRIVALPGQSVSHA